LAGSFTFRCVCDVTIAPRIAAIAANDFVEVTALIRFTTRVVII